ncbi:MAG: 30S ribosomal protein S17 [Deltaproteobacteria bacterium]|nr:30S ribosomal protein S17 [Deltaproteobacteria bacterium]
MADTEKVTRHKKILVGTVLSDKMDKTVVVQVKRLFMHPRYKKYVRKNATYKAHDEMNQCRIGDKVQIIESRPISKDKCWRVSKVVEKAV